MDIFKELPDLEASEIDALEAYITETAAAIQSVKADPSSFVNEDYSSAELLEDMGEAVKNLAAAREALAARKIIAEPEAEAGAEAEELSEEELAARVAALADEAVEPAAEPAPEATPEPAAEVALAEPVVASAAKPKRLPAPRPASRDRQPEPEPAPEVEEIGFSALTAAGEYRQGEELPSAEAISEMMMSRRRHFGIVPEGTSGERVPIARADWSHLYGEDRKLDGDEVRNQKLIDAVVRDEKGIRAAFIARREQAREGLVASGGLCAPVTPYYQLQMVTQAGRPVRAALPGFNADRGGIRYARPTVLTQITTAVGAITAANDALGGTFATKTCQRVICPSFQETDVESIFHCVTFGNLPARTFPENVTHMNNLVLGAHSRKAESDLLTEIDGFSTAVTAGDLGLGATSALIGQIMTARAGLISRHRMDTGTVMRVLLPWWAVPLLVSDGVRSAFYRYETDEAKVTALLREAGIEPSFYEDGANGASQVYGTQSAGALTPFPSHVRWYIYPEGSFLYLDGGTLELGLVRDSVLNATNDYQIFGETFENVAFVGVESLAVSSAISDTGLVAGYNNSVADPVVY